LGRIACERSGVEEIRRGQRVLETRRLTGKKGGFGGEKVERSCVEVWNRVWQMRTELN
jgi:hypothetical protein